jgi:N-dimethylarginine dimethylaminohydrolase
VYTANWAVTYRGKALLSKLPNARAAEEPYAQIQLQQRGFDCRRPADYFSGQGDALLFNDHEAIIGHGYRTKLTPGLKSDLQWLGITPVFVQALPQLDAHGQPQINRVTGLADSYYYDIDLAVAVIAPNVLAVCLDALTPASQVTIEKLQTRTTNPVTIINVSETEARRGFACNLLSTGRTVVMSDAAPRLASELKKLDYRVITTNLDQFKLTGGGIRCVSLTLNR